MEGIVAILRNGACVFKDLAPKHRAATFTYFIHHTLDGIPVLDILIAILQLAAVAFGVLGGLSDLSKAWSRLSRARKWIKGASHVESKTYARELRDIRGRLNIEAWDAAGACLDAIIRAAVGTCFYLLFFSTLKRMDEETVMRTTVAMEVLLVAALSRGFRSIVKRRAKALQLLKTTPEDLRQAALAQELVNWVENRLLFTWDNQVDYHPTALSADIGHLSRAYEKLEELAVAHKSKDADALTDGVQVVQRIRKSAKAVLSQTWFEAALLTMDLIAFWGYLIIPVAYYVPDEKLYRAYIRSYPGHDLVTWHGGFIGDLMWTIQPVVVLFGQAIRTALEDRWVDLPLADVPLKKTTTSKATKKKEDTPPPRKPDKPTKPVPAAAAVPPSSKSTTTTRRKASVGTTNSTSGSRTSTRSKKASSTSAKATPTRSRRASTGEKPAAAAVSSLSSAKAAAGAIFGAGRVTRSQARK